MYKTKRTRSKSPQKKQLDKRPIKNVFDLIQFKKMMGKNIIKIASNVVIDKKTISEEVKKIKDKIIPHSPIMN